MRVVVYGSRPDGHAKVVLELLLPPEFSVAGLIDDLSQNAARGIGAHRIIGSRSDLAALASTGVEGVVLGFGAAAGRKAVLQAVQDAGLALPILVHASAHLADSAGLSPGAQVLPHASIGPGARIGPGVLVNTGAIIEHDVSVGECSVIDPGVILAGRVSVGEEVEVGSGAVVLPDLEIGARAVIGAGAVVTRSVAGGQTVAGVPARELTR